MSPAIYFLSDYGTEDEFVGVVHAVLHRAAPELRVIDLSHHIPPYDIETGASMLERCAPALGPGVVLAVVDPGVGTARRPVALGLGTGGPAWLVGPDNGLLPPLAAAFGGVRRALALDRDRLAPPPARGAPLVGPTFDGRDLFAPMAAHLARGGAPEAVGDDFDPSTLVVLPSGPALDRGDGNGNVTGSALVTRVTWIDRFGNIQLHLDPGALDDIGLALGGTAGVVIQGVSSTGHDGTEPGAPVPARRVRAFGDLDPDELGLVTDGNGRVALVVNQASAALRLEASLGRRGPGATVRITSG